MTHCPVYFQRIWIVDKAVLSVPYKIKEKKDVTHMCSLKCFFFFKFSSWLIGKKTTVIDEKNVYFDEFLIVSNVKLRFSKRGEKAPNSSCYSTIVNTLGCVTYFWEQNNNINVIVIIVVVALCTGFKTSPKCQCYVCKCSSSYLWYVRNVIIVV